MAHLLIIGGSDAGISAALRAREVDPAVEVTVVVADRFPNFSICGLPFFLSGEIPDWHNLAHRTADGIRREGINLLLNHTAQAIDPAGKTVTVVDEGGRSRQVPYDKLVVGTGAVPARPPIEGLDLPGVFPMRTMADGFAVHDYLTAHEPESAVIVGAGYIGLEMADALTHRGLAVTVVEYLESVLTTMDPALGNVVGAAMQERGVQVATDMAVKAIEPQGTSLVVTCRGGSRTAPTGTALTHVADMVLVATGVRPETGLAASAGIELGRWGAIRVNRAMETNVPQIYAAGDCVETWHQVLDQYVYLPLGSTAHKQGRVAGENAAGGHGEFAGTLGTQAVKVFDLVAARTGLRDAEATAAGLDPLTVEIETWDHKVYYPGATRMHVRITGDRQTGRLLGAQIVGHRGAEVSKRVDVFATALFHKMKIDALNDVDLSYTPPLSSPWDPVQMSAQAWVKARG